MRSDLYLNYNYPGLKFLLTLLIIIFTCKANAQHTYNICQGDKVVLPLIEFGSGPAGSPGSPGNCVNIERNITPNDGVINRTQNSYTVSPLFTTNYTVKSRAFGPPDINCNSSNWITENFTVNVRECESTVCNVIDPFIELPWLTGIIDFKDANGFGYYDYINVHTIDNKIYIEIFAELADRGSKIYLCDGSLFCERKNDMDCSQFNQATIVNTLYNTNCTAQADEVNAGNNKIDLEAIELIGPSSIFNEATTGFEFQYKNSGPCYFFYTDFVIEVNGEIIGTDRYEKVVSAGVPFNVITNIVYNFKADTEYEVKIWPVNPNGNSDLNFANDTLKIFYEAFTGYYGVDIQEFLSPAPFLESDTHTVSIALYTSTNLNANHKTFVYWSVNGEQLISNTEYLTNGIGRSLDTIILGNYFFEPNKDYLIEAWVDLPPEIREPNKPLDKLSYFIPSNSAKVDLAIEGSNLSPFTFGEDIFLYIKNDGNVRIDDFIINWFINGVAQTPHQVKNSRWRSSDNGLTTDESTTVTFDPLIFNLDNNYELTFSIELPDSYKDINIDNNTYTFNYIGANRIYYEADIFKEVCVGDSVSFDIPDHSIRYPLASGLSLGCASCSIEYSNYRWTLNGTLIDTTNKITVKPAANQLYILSTDGYEVCGGCISSSGPYNTKDISAGIIVVDCAEPPTLNEDCSNNFGEVTTKYLNRIRTGRELYSAYDENGQPINFTSEFVKFDYELIDLPREDGYQPVTITCMQEFGESYSFSGYYGEVCESDQFETALEIPMLSNPKYSGTICNILKNIKNDNSYIENYFSEDCGFNFNVKNGDDRPTEPYFNPREYVRYNIKMQTVDQVKPFNLNWSFLFEYQEQCGQTSNPIFNTYSWLTNFVNPSDCANKRVLVYDADTYEFLVIETDSGESMYNSNGELICFSPAGGFSFIGLYNESRILNSWTCDEGFQGKESKPGIQNNRIHIFPNPTNNKVFINLQELSLEQPVISIYDIQGKEMLQTSSVETFAGILQLDVGGLDRGVYLLEVRSINDIFTEKLIVK